MKWDRCVSVMATWGLAVTAGVARADVFNMGPGLTSLEFVTVGNPGNVSEISGTAPARTPRIVGGVDYVYRIGKYEVTAGQYTAFLNAVAASDPYHLYYESQWTSSYGCKIKRSGSSGSYTYSVAADRANRPVNWVDWFDAARFVNWLHNGQGNGSTETGAYTLNGLVGLGRDETVPITHNADARYWIPTENEWYKAAYHKNDGVTGNYWDYPTSSDSTPSNDLLAVDPGNNANFYHDPYNDPLDYTIGSPYWMTEVGEFENSDSPYGTFDQCGNVFEWNETAVVWYTRGYRGGSWKREDDSLPSDTYYHFVPDITEDDRGFRVASVPEPAGITLMLCGAIVGLLWRKGRK